MHSNKLFHRVFISLLLAVVFMLAGCHTKESANELRVGTIDGPETELMEVAQQIAKTRYQLNIKIVPFTDYSLPNRALDERDIDVNMFQTIPFLEADTKAHGYDLKIVGKSFVYPMAIYSKSIKSLKAIPQNSTVSIPNDPSNEGRALLLLQKAGLLQLNPKAGALATPLDIQKNPKSLQIKELDAAQLPRSLVDVGLSIMNTNYAIPAGLYPSKDSLFSEDKSSVYVNVFVVKSGLETDARVLNLLKAFQTNEVKTKAEELFKGQAIAGW